MLSRIADSSYRLATNPVITRQVLPAASVALRRLAPHLASRGMHVATRRLAQPATPTPTRTARRDIQIGRDNGNLNPVLLFVPSAQEWMIERFGKYHRTAGPGLSVAIPLLEKVAYKRSLKESTLAIHPMTAITKDNVHVSLDGAVYVKCHDTYAASYEIGEPEDAIRILAQSCMRKEVGNLELDELFLEREKLNAAICSALDQATEPWGIRALRYEIADITVNHHTREAMEKQSNAERLRRAEVLESEGYRQRLINQSEGEKQQAINEASGAAEATRLRASADAEQIRLLAEAQAAATRAHADATADGLRAVAAAAGSPGGRDAMVQQLAEKYVGELAEMAKQSKLVIVPDRPNDVSGVLATAMGVYGQAEAHMKGAAERPPPEEVVDSFANTPSS